MKERKLTVVLAALAALALVFAAGCDTNGAGSSSSGGGTAYTSAISGLSFTYTGDDSTEHDANGTAKAFLGPVTLAFDDNTNSVSITVQYAVCTTATETKGTGGTSACSNDSADCTLYTWSGTGSYSYTADENDAADTVTVMLPASSDDPAVTGAYLTFEVDTGKLTLTEAKASAETDLTQYTVIATADASNSGTGVDIFDGDYGLAAETTEFELDE